jgi:hypothetical protein
MAGLRPWDRHRNSTQGVTLSPVDDGYGEPFERFDPVSGLPLPEDDDPELSAALDGWRAACEALGSCAGARPTTAGR